VAAVVGANTHGVPLRPIERRVRRLRGEGVPTAEIARRFRRAPGTIQRVQEMSELRQGDGSSSTQGEVLNPLERRILQWRADGVDHEEIGAKFRRSGDFVRRVEQFARHKLGTD
jgi:DNA-binding CsgD family transcriptional regulator